MVVFQSQHDDGRIDVTQWGIVLDGFSILVYDGRISHTVCT
jgi:hypothetical protein